MIINVNYRGENPTIIVTFRLYLMTFWFLCDEVLRVLVHKPRTLFNWKDETEMTCCYNVP